MSFLWKLKIEPGKSYKILHRKLKIEQGKSYKILHKKLKIEQANLTKYYTGNS
jgi:hypothetical protein